MSRFSQSLEDAVNALAAEVLSTGCEKLSTWCHKNAHTYGYAYGLSLANSIRNRAHTHKALEGIHFTDGFFHLPDSPPPAGEVRPQHHKHGDRITSAALRPRTPVRLSDAYLRALGARLQAAGAADKWDRLDSGECAIVADHLAELVALRREAGKQIPQPQPLVEKKEVLGGLSL